MTKRPFIVQEAEADLAEALALTRALRPTASRNLLISPFTQQDYDQVRECVSAIAPIEEPPRLSRRNDAGDGKTRRPRDQWQDGSPREEFIDLLRRLFNLVNGTLNAIFGEAVRDVTRCSGTPVVEKNARRMGIS